MISVASFRVGGLLALLACGLALTLSQQTSEAQVQKGKTRVAATKYLMRGIVQSNCAATGKMLKDGPKDDKGWDTLACHASILNEASYLLLDDGRCPDKTWADAAKTLRGCSAKLLTAANEKKLEDAQAAFKALTGACASCHKAHKK